MGGGADTPTRTARRSLGQASNATPQRRALGGDSGGGGLRPLADLTGFTDRAATAILSALPPATVQFTPRVLLEKFRQIDLLNIDFQARCMRPAPCALRLQPRTARSPPRSREAAGARRALTGPRRAATTGDQARVPAVCTARADRLRLRHGVSQGVRCAPRSCFFVSVLAGPARCVGARCTAARKQERQPHPR